MNEDPMKAIIQKQTNPEWLRMSVDASAEAHAFEANLKSNNRWREGAAHEISRRLDETAAAFSSLNLETAFAYKSLVGVAVRFLVETGKEMGVAQRFNDKIMAHVLAAQGEIVKGLAQAGITSEKREELTEFLGIVSDAQIVFYSTSDLVTDKRGWQPFG